MKGEGGRRLGCGACAKAAGYRVPMTTKPDDPDVQHDDETESEPESDAPAEPGSDDVSESEESAT